MKNAIFLLLAALIGFAVTPSCTKSEASPDRFAGATISAEAANNAILKYQSTSPALNYFRVNMEQLNAMNEILLQRPQATSFKLILVNGGIVVMGTDTTGDISLPIFSTSGEDSGPCPTCCDGR